MKHGNGKPPTMGLIQPRRQIVKIAICIPSRGVCDGGFTFDLANLAFWTSDNLMSRGVDLTMNLQMSSYIHANRTDLASLALADKDVTHLFWLDDDMRFPKNAIARLLQHRVDVVGVNYSHRKPPPQPVALKRNAAGKEDFRCVVCPDVGEIPLMQYTELRFKDRVVCQSCGTERWARNYRLQTLAETTGLEPVEAIGFGVVLITREVFEATQFPWFEHSYDHGNKRAIGEDTHFCWLAQQAGYPVFVDHDLSKDVRHAGSLEYSLEHANNWSEIGLAQNHDAKANALLLDAKTKAERRSLVVVP